MALRFLGLIFKERNSKAKLWGRGVGGVSPDLLVSQKQESKTSQGAKRDPSILQKHEHP